MSKGWNYVAGDWWAICDVCGEKHKASKMKKRWDGFMVCEEDFEQRHPQDFVKSKIDKIVVPWTRPRPIDSFILPLGLVDNVKTSSDSGQTYIDPTYFAEDYLTEGFVIELYITRSFADSVTPIETLSVDFNTAFSDSVTITDTAITSLTLVKAITDSVNVADAGYLFVNGYIDSSYFASDYVGTVSTF